MITITMPRISEQTVRTIISAKWQLGNAESIRQFVRWYNGKFARDYPDAYRRRWARPIKNKRYRRRRYYR